MNELVLIFKRIGFGSKSKYCCTLSRNHRICTHHLDICPHFHFPYSSQKSLSFHPQPPRSRKNFSSSQPSMESQGWKPTNDPTRGPKPPLPRKNSRSQPSMEGWEPTNDPTRGPQPSLSRKISSNSQPSMESQGWEPTNDPTHGPSSPNNGCWCIGWKLWHGLVVI